MKYFRHEIIFYLRFMVMGTGREGEELRMLNISDTFDLLVISLMRSGVYVSE